MYLILNWFCFFGVFFSTAYAARLPDTFKTCKKSDPNYIPCLKNAIEGSLRVLKNGLSSLGVPKIDPLFVEKIHIGGNGGKVDIEQDYKDLEVFGYGDSIVEEAELLLDGNDCKIKLKVLTPNLQLVGQYKMVGKVLILQINGFGANNITLTNAYTDQEIVCEKSADKNGKQILKLSAYNLDITTEKIQYQFENLVQGNAQLSEEVLKVINDNSLEIFEEIRKDYGRAFAEILKYVASSILSKVPYEEYYLA